MVAPQWRYARAWSEVEIKTRLDALASALPNFGPSNLGGSGQKRWRRLFSESVVAQEVPGLPTPSGAFERLSAAALNYEFSDPQIVKGHFNPAGPLLGRPMLLEIQALGFRFLCGTVVAEVIETATQAATVFGYRYDTLEGHLEAGSEWFVVRKDHESGRVTFRIEAMWRPGRLPSAWMRVGLRLLAQRYQKRWQHHAFERLRSLVKTPQTPLY